MYIVKYQTNISDEVYIYGEYANEEDAFNAMWGAIGFNVTRHGYTARKEIGESVIVITRGGPDEPEWVRYWYYETKVCSRCGGTGEERTMK